MKFLRALLVQLRQAFSWPLALCGLLMALMTELSVAGILANYFSGRDPYVNVWYLAQFNGASLLTLFVLPALPFSMSLARDWDSRALPYWAAREGVGRYTVSKLLASALAGLLTVGLGLTLFVLGNGMFLPWFQPCASVDYEAVFLEGRIFTGWLCYILHMSLSGALVGALGMFMSILAPNPFVAVSAPLAIHLTVMRVIPTELISPISIWHPVNWVESVHCTQSPWRTLLEKLLLTAGLCGLMCIAGRLRMKRRLEHG